MFNKIAVAYVNILNISHTQHDIAYVTCGFNEFCVKWSIDTSKPVPIAEAGERFTDFVVTPRGELHVCDLNNFH
jgi:hypothetical protein